MKKSIIIIAALLALGYTTAKAQNVMLVDSEKVFLSVTAYTDAMQQLDQLAQQYDTQIENAYVEIENMFNNYQNEKAYLSATVRQQREDAILDREQQILQRQEEIFGQQGELLQKRVELIKPIQDRVFGVINDYAQRNGYAVVIDIASNPTVLYYAPSAEKTNEIIALLR